MQMPGAFPDSPTSSASPDVTAKDKAAAAHPESDVDQEIDLLDITEDATWILPATQQHPPIYKDAQWLKETSQSIMDSAMDEFELFRRVHLLPSNIVCQVVLSCPCGESHAIDRDLYLERCLITAADELRNMRRSNQINKLLADERRVNAPFINVQKAGGPHHARRLAQREYGKCPVCARGYDVPCETACGHVFCIECVQPWLREYHNCPTCRAAAEVNELKFHNGFVKAGYEDVFGIFDDEVDEETEKKWSIAVEHWKGDVHGTRPF